MRVDNINRSVNWSTIITRRGERSSLFNIAAQLQYHMYRSRNSCIAVLVLLQVVGIGLFDKIRLDMEKLTRDTALEKAEQIHKISMSPAQHVPLQGDRLGQLTVELPSSLSLSLSPPIYLKEMYEASTHCSQQPQW